MRKSIVATVKGKEAILLLVERPLILTGWEGGCLSSPSFSFANELLMSWGKRECDA